MSVEKEIEKPSQCVETACSEIELIIDSRETDLGGFSVGRVLPSAKRRMVGPWIFFDHMGPAVFEPGIGINVRPHPHINLATVTYLFEGEIFHRDSLGNALSIHPGDINLMVAGRGITHSERETAEAMKSPRKLNGLQLWMALPRDQQEVDPDFLHYPSAEIPQVDVEGVPLRIMIGEAFGVKSPVKTFASTLYLEARVGKDQSFELPPAQERGLYVVSGKVEIGGDVVTERQMALLSNGSTRVTAREDSLIALVGGEAFEKRHMYWNFVSTSKERIEKAKQDWQQGRFPKVVGDEEDFIPLPS